MTGLAATGPLDQVAVAVGPGGGAAPGSGFPAPPLRRAASR